MVEAKNAIFKVHQHYMACGKHKRRVYNMLEINNNQYRPSKSPNFKGLTAGPKTRKAFDKLGGIKSPGQRLIFGASALALHPLLDKINPWVDEETKKISTTRSAAKAIASTATGVVIREACIVGTDAILNNKNIAGKLPKYMLKDKGHTAAVIGTLMGLAVMVFTNFLIDVPLTDKLTAIFTKMRNGKNQKNLKTSSAKEMTGEHRVPAPSFSKNTKDRIHIIEDKIKKGELPPMSQVNMEVIKWA